MWPMLIFWKRNVGRELVWPTLVLSMRITVGSRKLLCPTIKRTIKCRFEPNLEIRNGAGARFQHATNFGGGQGLPVSFTWNLRKLRSSMAPSSVPATTDTRNECTYFVDLGVLDHHCTPASH